MNRTLIGLVFLALWLSGCAHLGGGTIVRIPVNPPDFKPAASPMADDVQGLRMERDSLASAVSQLRNEVMQLRTLFRLQNLPLEGELRSSDARAGRRHATRQATVPAVGAADAKPNSLSTSLAPLDALPAAPRSEPRTLDAPVSQGAAAAIQNRTYSALFRFASSSLDDTAKSALAALAPQLAGAELVRLSGFADTSGDAGANAKLAQARAAAVYDELTKLGVPMERVVVATKVAESQPPAHATLLGLFRSPDSLSRRVDLVIQQTAAAR